METRLPLRALRAALHARSNFGGGFLIYMRPTLKTHFGAYEKKAAIYEQI